MSLGRSPRTTSCRREPHVWRLPARPAKARDDLERATKHEMWVAQPRHYDLARIEPQPVPALPKPEPARGRRERGEQAQKN